MPDFVIFNEDNTLNYLTRLFCFEASFGLDRWEGMKAVLALLAKMGNKEKGFGLTMTHVRFLGVGPAVGVVVIGLSRLIYDNTNEIVLGMERARVEEGASFLRAKPAYFGLKRKHNRLSSLQIPLYFENGPTGLYSIRIEFSIETSNRYLKQYIDNHEHEVRDCILTNLEPALSQFILTREGLDIIKLKVLDELNDFIKKRRVEGRIEKVNVAGMIAG